MDNNEKIKVDELLDVIKKDNETMQDYKSLEQFKNDFFIRVKEEKRKELIHSFKFMGVAAAMLFVFLGTLFALVNIASINNERPTPVAQGVAVVTSAPVEVQKNTSKVKSKSSRSLKKNISSDNICFSPPVGVVGLAPLASDENDICSAPISFNTEAFNTEEYKSIQQSGFIQTSVTPLSTFGADVDTASYTNVRRFLRKNNCMPPKDSVRTEEFLNYFSYDYQKPQGNDDFAVTFESMNAPWDKNRKLLLVGVQAKDIEVTELPSSNFVFLIDNSGSMTDQMPLVIESMTMLANQLRPEDRISIVTYGSKVSVLLDGKSGKDKQAVKNCIKAITVGGYTPGGAGILEAYKLARKNFIKGGNNRIVLITDGDFNVGVSSEAELVQLVEKERNSSVYLSAIGVGYGNYKDNKLKMLANKGNGNYFYLDNISEAKRVMTTEMSGKMFAFAKDVKFQIEFNPAQVVAYRLIGYELRALNDRDFNDDTKDSGDVGVGHQVTAVYELIMVDADESVKKRYQGDIDKLKYQQKTTGNSDDILTFKLRYQEIEKNSPSKLLSFELKKLPKATQNIQWAAAVTEFCMLLQDSEYKGNANYKNVRKRAKNLLGEDNNGKRAEFLTLVKTAEDFQK